MDEDSGHAARVCSVCTREFAKYTCPRCAVQYCGVACYKAHDAGCTEQFHREQVETALRASRAAPDDVAAMRDILKRMHAHNLDGGDDVGAGLTADGDEDAEGELTATGGADAERVARLAALAEADRVEEIELTAEERRDFERHVANGTLLRQMDRSEPWWTRVDLASISRRADGHFGCAAPAAPAMLPTVPAFSTLTSRSPPHSFRYVVLEAVVAYAYLVRLFDSEPHTDPADASTCALQLSAALSGDERRAFVSARAALASVATRCADPRTRTSAAFYAAVLSDARALCGAAGAVALSLSDLHVLLSSALESVRDTAARADAGARPTATASAAEQKRWRFALRKVLFMVSWWLSHDEHELQATCLALAGNVHEHQLSLAAHSRGRGDNGPNGHGGAAGSGVRTVRIL